MATTLKNWVKQWSARLVRYGILAQTDATGFDQLEGTLGVPSDPLFQHPVRRFQHYGFRSRPRVGAELICVSPRGGTSNRVSIASEVSGQGPQEQQEGEVEIYSEFGQRIILSTDGTITLKEFQGGKATFSQKTLSVDQCVESQHFQGKGPTPIVTPGPGLGGGTVALRGSDAGFILNFVVVKTTPGPLAIVFFAEAYKTAPVLGLCLLDSATAKAMALTPFYALPSAASIQVLADGLLPGSYQLSFVVVG